MTEFKPSMKADLEIYKGIEFVRIFSLPDEQKVIIWKTLQRDKIIKILRDNTLLSDCILYKDYEQWYAETFSVQQAKEEENEPTIQPVLVSVLK